MSKKHERYTSAYLPGEVYWGLGIENETYIEFENGVTYDATFVRNQKRERYSVDYWKTYKSGYVSSITEHWIASNGNDSLLKYPLLMNAHSLTKTDRFGEPVTTYTKNPSPNPKFCGTTLYQDLCSLNPDVFSDGYDTWWTQDGDTIEFMTQHYYCAKMEDVIDELIYYKKRWLNALQEGLHTFPDRDAGLQGGVNYPEKNHGLAVFLTNRKNIAIFNNGTYHINITLPTYLDKDAKIANMELFESQHRCAARLFQWLSPFLVAKFGSGDVFATLGTTNSFPRGSQRLCASRYVSVGMYNTDTMPRGKIVTIPNDSAADWYNHIYDMSGCAYERLPALGVDINYNKHSNHGLEFRIFDWFPETKLDEVFRLLIWMCDESLEIKYVVDPRKCAVWNSVLARAVWEGSSTMLTLEEVNEFSNILRVPLRGPLSILDVYECIWKTWLQRWNTSTGTCTQRMIKHPIPQPFDASPPRPVPVVPPSPPAPPATVEIVKTKKRFFCC